MWKHHKHDEHVECEKQIRLLIIEREILMAAIDNLNSNIATLKAQVETLLSNSVNSTPNSQVQAAADAVAAISAEVAPPAPAPAG